MSYQVHPAREVGASQARFRAKPIHKQQPLKTFVHCLCRYPLGEFLRAHRDRGHRPRFPPLLRHPSPEVPGEPSDPGGRLPEVPRGRHPQAHYRERLAGTWLLLCRSLRAGTTNLLRSMQPSTLAANFHCKFALRSVWTGKFCRQTVCISASLIRVARPIAWCARTLGLHMF